SVPATRTARIRRPRALRCAYCAVVPPYTNLLDSDLRCKQGTIADAATRDLANRGIQSQRVDNSSGKFRQTLDNRRVLAWCPPCTVMWHDFSGTSASTTPCRCRSPRERDAYRSDANRVASQ